MTEPAAIPPALVAAEPTPPPAAAPAATVVVPAVVETDAGSSPDAPGLPGTGQDAGARTEAYHGRRRAQKPRAVVWLVVGLVVLGLVGAVGLPYLLRSAAQPAAGSGPVATSRPAPVGIMASEEGEMLPATSLAPITPTPGTPRARRPGRR